MPSNNNSHASQQQTARPGLFESRLRFSPAMRQRLQDLREARGQGRAPAEVSPRTNQP